MEEEEIPHGTGLELLHEGDFTLRRALKAECHFLGQGDTSNVKRGMTKSGWQKSHFVSAAPSTHISAQGKATPSSRIFRGVREKGLNRRPLGRGREVRATWRRLSELRVDFHRQERTIQSH